MKNLKRLSTKTLATLLSFLIVVSIIPMHVFASEYQNYLTLTSMEEPVEEEMIIRSEVVDKRDEYSKTYLLDDGTYCSITSVLPLHELVQGEWENIDPEVDETTPETINEALTLITYEQNVSTFTSVDDGYTNNEQLDINLIGVDENNTVNYDSFSLNSTSFGIIDVNIFNPDRAYNKAEVTIDAELKLLCNTLSSYTISVQPLYSDWREADNKYSALTTEWETNPIIDYNTIDSGGRYSWDITSEFIKYENGTNEHYGFLLSTNESGSVFISSGAVLRHYRIIDDNDLGFTYHVVDMGRAGTVYVNDFTNTFYLERQELSLNGFVLPVSLSRFINNIANSHSFAAGGRWNYESRLTSSSDTYVWDMFNGSSTRFQIANGETDSENREKWEEYTYNSQGYTLWVDATRSRTFDYSNNIIIDNAGYTYTFNEYGLVDSIISPENSNDSLSIEYNGETITCITDGAGREYNFNYTLEKNINIINSINVESNGEQIKIVTDEIQGDSFVSADVEILYEYQIINNIPYLSKATYADGQYVEYTYDSIGRLLSVKNIDNSILEFTYSINTTNAINSKNPAYFGKISSYSKSVLNENNEYEIDFIINIDAQNSYRRIFTQINNNDDDEIVLTETTQYNRNLDVLYMTSDPIGDSYYADYDDSHQLLSLVIPENADNLITSGDMSSWKRGNRVPQYWNAVNISDTANSVDCKRKTHVDTNNNYYVCISNSLSITRMLTQTIELNNAKSGDKYVISAWGLSGATLPREDHFWGIRILAKKANNEYVEIHTMAFDASLWNIEQTRTTAFSLPFDTNEITVQLVSSQQLGETNFDDICLYKTENAYVAAVDNVDSIKTCTCDDCEFANCTCDPTKEEGPCKCVSCKIKTTSETINNKRIITTTNGSENLIYQYEYTTDSNYPLNYTDENNISTSYQYSLTNGLLLSETFASNASISYGYDAIGALTSVSQGVNNIRNASSNTYMSTNYSYENDKISSISHNDFSYDYEYDIYGNIKSISVNNSPLVTYAYNDDYNRSLGSITYGNGKKLSYAYDTKGNITEIYIDNETSPTYEYEYDIYNNLVTYTDNSNNTITSYNKTIGEKTYEMVVQRINDGTIIYSIDDSSDSSYVESVFGRDYSISRNISYDSESGTSTVTTATPVILFNEDGKATVTTTSDSLDRRVEEKLKFTIDNVAYQNASIEVKNEYTYKDINASQTSRLFETFKATLIVTDENGNSTSEELINLKYKYDVAGRIITIYEYRTSGASGYYHPIALYEYDNAGQLIAEAHGFSNEVWGYTYDAGGNITSKNKLNYNDVIFEDVDNPHFINLDTTVPLDTINYEYHDAYKDLLVSFDGKSITYDDAFNPLNYHGFTIGGETSMNLIWAGRNLVEAISQDGEYKFKYAYDASGLRTEKAIYEKESFYISTTDANGNPTSERKSEFIKSCVIEYVWSNGVVVAQKVSTYSPDKDENGNYIMDDNGVVVKESNVSIIVKPLYNDYNEPLGVNCYITTQDDVLSETFYFIKDAQGNVRSIYSMEYDYAINMNYDAFGNYSLNMSGTAIDEMQDSIINANGELGQTIARILTEVAMVSMVCITFTAAPHSYRGYIYDIESGLYYCQSRYYSPSWGRFINADEAAILEMTIGNVHGANLFTYCNNDPVNFTDASGFFATSWIVPVVDVAIIVIPAIFSINQMLLKGKVAASVFSKVSDDLAKIIADFLVEKVKSKVAINIGLTVAKNLGKLVNYFSKISVGFLVEYVIDCLDGLRNHDLNTKAKLKFRIIL